MVDEWNEKGSINDVQMNSKVIWRRVYAAGNARMHVFDDNMESGW